jgi:hypothetical protein
MDENNLKIPILELTSSTLNTKLRLGAIKCILLPLMLQTG